MNNITELAKSIYDNQIKAINPNPSPFCGGFLIDGRIIAVVINLGNQFGVYIYQLNDKQEWEYLAAPLLNYLMENLNDFIPAKKKFLVEVEVNTPIGDYKPDEAISNLIWNQNNKGKLTRGETFEYKLVGTVENGKRIFL